MRVCLLDTILERHVADSLARALVARGHDVLAPGKIWKGFHFPSEAGDLARINSHLDQIIDWQPDCVLVMRAATLTPDMIARLRRAGIVTCVWLPDDPVLYDICYRHVIDHHDIVLHCGGTDLLRFYRARGHGAGVNFPFWTDHAAFAPCYAPDAADLDMVFLGNCAGPVRRNRYGTIAALPGRTRIFGKVEQDPKAIHARYINDPDNHTGAISRALGQARLALNIPQYFRDYQGLPYDFPDLAGLGCFQIPSRVIQYAASGLPVLSIGPDQDLATVFPEVAVARSRDEAIAQAKTLLADPDALRARAQDTLARFRRDYSAEARAKLLEHLLCAPQTWRGASASTRAHMFMGLSPG